MVRAAPNPPPLVVLSGDKVGDLKRLVGAGYYQPDPRAIAEAMLKDPEARLALGLDPRWSLVARAPSRASWPVAPIRK